MDNKSYTATILVDQDPATAFNAITNFRAWWSEEIGGNTDQLNGVFFYHYKDVHLCKIKLIEIIPEKKLVYQVLENEFSFTEDKTEWVDTRLVFEITSEGGKTKVQFTHEGLVPDYECYDVCFEAWTGYIKKSLYSLITTGKGEPNPAEGDGFNAALAEKWKLDDRASDDRTRP
ncbi:SRPBCC domain-containing protein [Paradesertivirga mongoliensis]|uniref:SRPBCC domain-containing protein n=1 Tax=Paradesertivirga mongoliensis TaxID=2100740 RepID=A0ABW4ZSC2_9SPHI|nr:SRPBCC domain-containing protein [Pedobacter mongoliensis]